MDLVELQEIAEKERRGRKPVSLRCCVAAGCLSANAQAVKQRLQETVTAAGLEQQVEVCGVGCMRLCSQGPLVQADPDGALYQQVTPDGAPALVAALGEAGADAANLPSRGDPAQPFFTRQFPIVLENSGLIDPERIESYIARGGYQALYHALHEMTPPRWSGDHQQWPARARRRRLPDRAEVGHGGEIGRRAQVHHLQRRRGRPRRVHGPQRPGE